MYSSSAGPFGIGLILIAAFCALCVAVAPGNMTEYHTTATICSKQEAGTQKTPVYVLRSSKTTYTIRDTWTITVNGKDLKPSEAFSKIQSGTRYELAVYKGDEGERYINSVTRSAQQSSQHC